MATVIERNEGMIGTAPSRLRAFESSRFFPIALLTPILFFFILLNVIPTLYMVGLSFYTFSLTSPAPPEFAQANAQDCLYGSQLACLPVGNFIRIYEDSQLWSAFGRTISFTVIAVGIQTVLGVLLGFLFWGSNAMPGRRVALTMLFTPMVLTPVASGLFWRLIYEPTFGVINYLITALGGTKIDFLTNADWALAAVLFVDIWMWTPFMILMTLAALGSVPKAELEAAEVDRMSVWKRLRYVILPHARFILMLGILLRTIDAFKTTDLVFLMTNGGPGNVTEFIGLSLYRYAFASLNLGFSSSLALILLLIAIAFTSVYLYILNARRRTEGA
jgi:multiple sugar transport system permease protein